MPQSYANLDDIRWHLKSNFSLVKAQPDFATFAICNFTLNI